MCSRLFARGKSACFTIRKMEFPPLLSLSFVVREMKIVPESWIQVFLKYLYFFFNYALFLQDFSIFSFFFVFPFSINNISNSLEEILVRKFDPQRCMKYIRLASIFGQESIFLFLRKLERRRNFIRVFFAIRG